MGTAGSETSLKQAHKLSRTHATSERGWRLGTSEQVRARVGPVVGPDELPVEVVVLALPVVAEARVRVLVEGAAGCREERSAKVSG